MDAYQGIVADIRRHPVKGFTPERLASAELRVGECFPCDRRFAVEDGPSGFDSAAPAHVSKMRFAVLAKIAEVARARTAYDEASGVLTAVADGMAPFAGDLARPAGRLAFEAWLGELLGEAAEGPLRVLEGPGSHRFMDSKRGHVSVVNLASVADLARRVGRPLDPLRFRANLYVEGWPPWIENGWTDRTLSLGAAEAVVIKPIVRCAATSVDPTTALRDVDLPAALFEHYGHVLCGIYLNVTRAGTVAQGDLVR
jgi:uncharacterized protein YcbX